MSPPRRPVPPPPPPGRLSHVLVDFENVPTVDLSALGDQPVRVTLLIGEKQRRLDLKLVRQIHEHADKVSLVEVGASGRNALDLVLAWHLGHVAERHPQDAFFVISRDKDYDPLIRHLHGRGLEVARVESFAALPFLRPRAAQNKQATPAAVNESTRRSASARPAGATPAAPTPPAADDRLAKLIDRLEHRTKARPVRRKTLLSHIKAFCGGQLSDPELESIVTTLEERGIIRIDRDGHVEYAT